MNNVWISFEKLNGVTPEEIEKVEIRPWYKCVGLHIIFV